MPTIVDICRYIRQQTYNPVLIVHSSSKGPGEEKKMQQLEQVTTKSVAIGRLTSRFIWAAIIQGLAALLWTVPIVLPTVKPSVAMVMASGGAGTWFTVGYLAFITVGVIAIAVTALFYR